VFGLSSLGSSVATTKSDYLIEQNYNTIIVYKKQYIDKINKHDRMFLLVLS